MTTACKPEINEAAAERALSFFRALKLTQGQWAGKNFELLPWQEKMIREVFGTLKPDGNRQYNTVYVEIPKKNGKSPTASAVALYLLFADNEPGAEIYGAACDRDQAAIVFNVAAQMVRQCPALAKRAKVVDSTKRIIVPSTNSYYRVLSSDVATKHGFNTHGVIIDELHAQPNRDLYDVLTKGAGDARRQPLFFFITTAGNDRNSICWEVHEKARQILNGTREDPTFYPVIYSAEDEDDWHDEDIWYKANPSLGHIIDIEKVRQAHKDAQENPADESTFRQLRLNQWVSAYTKWISVDKWDACDLPLPDLEGRSCYAGLDLSSSIDLTALVLVFPFEDYYAVLPHFWIPEETMIEKERKEHVPYRKWVAEGYITATEGNVIDYQAVLNKLIEWGQVYDLKEIAYDRWGATKLIQDIESEGFTCVPFGQGFASMSGPTKELEKLVVSKKIAHGGHPVLRWNFDNVQMKMDAAGNIKPDKEKSMQKIDGIVALIEGLDRAMRYLSVYDERGIRTL